MGIDLRVNSTDRLALEVRLVSSYETYVALRHAFRQSQVRGSIVPGLFESLSQERQVQRYLHALLGLKGEPPGLLY